jgi:hypothetical protein
LAVTSVDSPFHTYLEAMKRRVTCVGFDCKLDQIDFRKNVAARHVVIGGLHVGQGGLVGNGDRVEGTVVAAGAPGAILLEHQVQGGFPR